MDTELARSFEQFKHNLNWFREHATELDIFNRYIESSDISMLGRDVTDRFSVIYDRPDQAVVMLSPPHRYEIKTA